MHYRFDLVLVCVSVCVGISVYRLGYGHRRASVSDYSMDGSQDILLTQLWDKAVEDHCELFGVGRFNEFLIDLSWF